MGTLLSRSLSLLPTETTASRGSFTPTLAEVHQTLSLLTQRLPTELGIAIINAAAYWPRVQASDKSHRLIRASGGETVERIILLSPNVRGKAVGQARVCVDSRDQGQSPRKAVLSENNELTPNLRPRLVVVPSIPSNTARIDFLVRARHPTSHPQLPQPLQQQSRFDSYHSTRISLPRLQHLQLSHANPLPTLLVRFNGIHRGIAWLALVGAEPLDDVEIATATTAELLPRRRSPSSTPLQHTRCESFHRTLHRLPLVEISPFPPFAVIPSRRHRYATIVRHQSDRYWRRRRRRGGEGELGG